MAPTRAHTTIVPRCSSDIPRRLPIRSIHHAPRRYPTAMPTPWGEMASGPSLPRSRTGHPIAARRSTAASLANQSGRDGQGPPISDGTPKEQSPCHIRRIVHAEVHARARHEAGERTESAPGRSREFEVPTGDGEECRENHRVTARPRRSAWLEDQEAERACGVVGADAPPYSFQHLAHD